MSLIEEESFDCGDHLFFQEEGGAGYDLMVPNPVVDSGYAMRYSSAFGAHGYSKRYLASASADLLWLFHWMATGTENGAAPILNLLSGSTVVAQVWTIDRKIEVWKGNKSSGGSLLGSSSQVLINSRNYHFEFRYKVDATGGIVEFRIDGNSRISLSSQDTGTGTIDRYSIGSNGGTTWFDSLRVYDGSDFPQGIHRMITLFPNGASAAGGHDQFTNVGGATKQASMGDFSDATYVYSTVDAQKQFFTLPAHGLPSDATIINKTIRGKAKKISGGGLIPNVRIASTDYAGSEWSLGTGIDIYFHRMMTNPATSNPWDVTDTEEIGVEANI